MNDKTNEAMIYSLTLFGWIKAGMLMDEVKQLGYKVEQMNSKIQEIRRNIDFHYHYSSIFGKLENEFQNLETRLNRINDQLGLSEKFDNALTDQRSYWRMVSSSYLEIKSKVNTFYLNYVSNVHASKSAFIIAFIAKIMFKSLVSKCSF